MQPLRPFTQLLPPAGCGDLCPGGLTPWLQHLLNLLLHALNTGLVTLLAALSKEMAVGFLFVLPLWHLATAPAGNPSPPRRGTEEGYS